MGSLEPHRGEGPGQGVSIPVLVTWLMGSSEALGAELLFTQ